MRTKRGIDIFQNKATKHGLDLLVSKLALKNAFKRKRMVLKS